jgi:L-ascorbate metabolism protein UlaG (beta-lactamase superfamily)
LKIQFHGYNAFLVETGDKVIAIDPGALFFYWFRFTPLLPPSRWQDITHIFITHGDPDHYWHADRVARASNAPVICNKAMLRQINGKTLALGPRAKGLSFTTQFENIQTLSAGETIEVDGIDVTGVKATHGELVLKVGPFVTTVKPGPEERIGWGSLGFDITVNGRRILNLGDTLLHEQEWKKHSGPDVLMIPIGGRVARNTMNEDEALQAVKALEPKHVIPCHYNCPGLFSRTLNPADDERFKEGVEQLGIPCTIMRTGDVVEMNGEEHMPNSGRLAEQPNMGE